VSLRCGCSAEGDEIVFGPVHECSKDPGMRNPKGSGIRPLAPSWVIVAPAFNRAYEAALDAANLTQQDFTLCPPERPYEHVLGEDETHD
jgi:hypothetical protein